MKSVALHVAAFTTESYRFERPVRLTGVQLSFGCSNPGAGEYMAIVTAEVGTRGAPMTSGEYGRLACMVIALENDATVLSSKPHESIYVPLNYVVYEGESVSIDAVQTAGSSGTTRITGIFFFEDGW